MKRKIRRRCKCGCRNITNPEKKWIRGHNSIGRKLSKDHKLNLSLALMGNINTLGHKLSNKHKRKLSLAGRGKKHSGVTKLKMSLSAIGNENALGYKQSKEHKRKISLANKGHRHSKEAKLKMSLAKIKHNPNYKYCEVWYDKEYLKDIRKDYCENVNCKKKSSILHNHHVYLNKKRCAPDDIMTLCMSCHIILHRKLQRGKRYEADPKHYIIINRPNHVSYIHKKSRRIIRVKRLQTA